MANQIRLKRGSGSSPSTSDLVVGEVAVRTDTGQLFTKKDDGNIEEIGAQSGIADGSITNAKVNASAAIAGSKISPIFGSQNVSMGEKLTLSATTPNIEFTDTNHNPDYRLKVDNGALTIEDAADNSDKFVINSDGHIDILGNLDVGSGIDVTGNITSTGDIKIDNINKSVQVGDITNDNYLQLIQVASSSVRGFSVQHTNASVFENLQGTTNQHIVLGDVSNDDSRTLFGVSITQSGSTAARLTLSGNGNLDVHNNITLGGTIDGVDLAGLQAAKNSISTSNGAILNGVTATTQSAGDNSTKIATTAYADTAISNLVDSSPSALNTLNELAAALGDDANFSSTVNTNIAAKLPKTGGTMSGDIAFGDNNRIKMGGDHGLQVYRNSNVSHIAESGTGPLRISTDEFQLMNVAQNSTMIYAPQTGGVSINYSGNTKIQTTNTGATITGTCTATAFAGDGSALTGIVSFVSGMILLWSGSTGNIPSGWVLCDGNAGTPNLQDRFVIGAGNSYSVGATGGSTTDTVNITVSGTTGGPGGTQSWGGYPPQNQLATSTHTHSFSGSGTDTISTMSPYYALCYIMKT